MKLTFDFCSGYGNRTHIARLRILSTNRYTNPPFVFGSANIRIKMKPANILLEERKEYSENNQSERHKMIPLNRLVLEHQSADYSEHRK